MEVLAENPFIDAAALPFLAGIALGLVLKLPLPAPHLAATTLLAVVSLVIGASVFGMPT